MLSDVAAGPSLDCCMGAGASVQDIELVGIRELAKPWNGSDLKDFDDAKEEVVRLRQIITEKLSKVDMKDLNNSGKRTIHVVHFNDVYNLEPSYTDDPVGGASRFSTCLKQITSKLIGQGYANPLILFSGDFVGPSLVSTFTQGAHMVEAFNFLNVHYGTFGNHEFDYGYNSLVARLSGVDDDVDDDETGCIDYPATKTTWLMTNITESTTGLPAGYNPSDNHVVRSSLVSWGTAGREIKVGLIGVSEDWLSGCLQVKDDFLKYEDYIESARNEAISLKAQGAEVVLALTHSRLSGDRDLMLKVPEIDMLLGGHDHFYKHDRKLRILKTGEEWRWLSLLTIKVGDGGARKPEIWVDRYDVDEELPLDPGMEAIREKFEAIRHKKYDKKLLTFAQDINPRAEVVRFKESNFVSWVCDALAQDYSEKVGSQCADICMIMGGLVKGKAIKKAGDFSFGDLMSVFPDPLKIVVLELTGEEVIKSLSLGAKSLPGESYGMHHVSGRLSYSVLLPKTTKDVAQVQNVLFDGTPIELNRKFSVRMIDTMAKGEFGYSWLKTAPRLVDEEVAGQIQFLLRLYGKQTRQQSVVVNLPALGRITLVDPE